MGIVLNRVVCEMVWGCAVLRVIFWGFGVFLRGFFRGF